LLVYRSAGAPTAAGIVEALAHLIPNARTALIPGAAHGMLDSHAGAVTEIMVEFCAS
jgi:pimeloyl-ACP methyl ester carboxylesterase